MNEDEWSITLPRPNISEKKTKVASSVVNGKDKLSCKTLLEYLSEKTRKKN